MVKQSVIVCSLFHDLEVYKTCITTIFGITTVTIWFADVTTVLME